MALRTVATVRSNQFICSITIQYERRYLWRQNFVDLLGHAVNSNIKANDGSDKKNSSKIEHKVFC